MAGLIKTVGMEKLMLSDVLFRLIAGSMPPGKARDMSTFQGPTQPAVRPKSPAAIEENGDYRGL